MTLASFKLNADSVTRFAERIQRNVDEQLRDALYDIRREFIIELDRQQKRLSSSSWQMWEPGYAKQRKAEYYGTYAGVSTNYFSKLKRTGRLMQGYMSSVVINEKDLSVRIPFPKGETDRGYDLEDIAQVHQGVRKRPKGVPARPFDVEKFKMEGKRRFEKAIRTGIVIGK